MRHFYFVFLILTGLAFFVHCQSNTTGRIEEVIPPLTLDLIYDSAAHWVDSVYNSLTEDERIAQLFWLAVEQPDNVASFEKLKVQVDRHQPGGILLFRMGAQRVLSVIETLNGVSKIPLLVSIDGEWGLGMRLPEVSSFPYAMTLGAIQDDSLIYEMGIEIARQFRVLGIHVNMAPVADVNSNPNNPVIGHRSFGEQPGNVARKAVAYMKGLQDGGVMAVGKHFPGHGDTDTDSHKTLPVVGHSKALLDTSDLIPFKAMIDEGLWGLMTAHIEVPALDQRRGMPASFSDSVLYGLLRQGLGFKGLVITDAVNMQGAKTMGSPGMVDALALAAGNDIVEFTEDLPGGIMAVKQAIADSLMTMADVEDKCRRSLAFKYWLTTHHSQAEVNLQKPDSALNASSALELNQQLHDAALTVLVNDGLMPMKGVPENYACVVVGQVPQIAQHMQQQRVPVYALSTTDPAAFDKVLSGMPPYAGYVLIIADSQWGRRTVNNTRRSQLIRLATQGSSLAVFMGNAYHLSPWKGLDRASGLVVSYQNSLEAQQAVLKLMNGAIGANGRLPVSVKNWFRAGNGKVVVEE
jgi:beta-glucosidase-like glycosyl hydrolase